jgi:hypothetical protein
LACRPEYARFDQIQHFGAEGGHGALQLAVLRDDSIFQSRYEPKMLGSWRLLLAGLIWLKMEV